MNAAARASVVGLLADESIERVAVDESVVRNLLRQAGNHIRTAQAGADAGDPEGAFQLAYDACRKASLALVMATGLRPKGQAAHVITFEAAGAISSSFGGRQLVTDAAQLRYVRHGAEYRAEAVSPADLDDAIVIAEDLIKTLTPAVDKLLSRST